MQISLPPGKKKTHTQLIDKPKAPSNLQRRVKRTLRMGTLMPTPKVSVPQTKASKESSGILPQRKFINTAIAVLQLNKNLTLYHSTRRFCKSEHFQEIDEHFMILIISRFWVGTTYGSQLVWVVQVVSPLSEKHEFREFRSLLECQTEINSGLHQQAKWKMIQKHRTLTVRIMCILSMLSLSGVRVVLPPCFRSHSHIDLESNRQISRTFFHDFWFSHLFNITSNNNLLSLEIPDNLLPNVLR